MGKTSLACATAVVLADRGKRVLLVSTDPASNLDEVLETRLGSEPTPVGRSPQSGRPQHRSRWLPLAPTAIASWIAYRGILPAGSHRQHGGAAVGRLYR